MKQVPTLDELTAQLEAQNAELATAADLADTMPAGLTVDENFVQAFDDATEERVAPGGSVLNNGIRA